MDRLPSLKAVHYFDTAVRHQSFTAAAQALHVTQSAVSRMIQTLESELGVALFTRQGRLITLTPAGEVFARKSRQAIDLIAQASQQARAQSAEQALTIGVNPAFAARWLVPRLPDFQRLHPHIHLHLVGNELDEAPAPTSTVWIRYGTGPWPGMSVTKLPIATRLGLVGAPSLLARHGPLRRPQDGLGKPLLAYAGRQHDLWQDYFQQFHLPMAALDKASRYQQLLTLTEAAVSGLGYALVPQFLIEPELGAGKLQAALPQTFEFGRQHVLLHRRDAAQDQKVQRFKRWLVAQARAAQAA